MNETNTKKARFATDWYTEGNIKARWKNLLPIRLNGKIISQLVRGYRVQSDKLQAEVCKVRIQAGSKKKFYFLSWNQNQSRWTTRKKGIRYDRQAEVRQIWIQAESRQMFCFLSWNQNQNRWTTTKMKSDNTDFAAVLCRK